MQSAATPLARLGPVLIVTLAVALASGCSNRETFQVGRFEAGTVTGLHYATPTTTGLTGADGTFRYRKGENVTFSIGGITLGSAPGAEVISPFTLAGIAPPTTEAAIRAELRFTTYVNSAFTRALKIGLVLLSLDVDGNPDDGIGLSGRDDGLRDAQLDLDQYLHNLRPAVRRLADDVNADISSSRLVTYLYQALGITVQAQVTTRLTRDDGSDGATDFAADTSYGSDGSLIQSFDNDGDGHVNKRYTQTYDSLGRELTSLVETDSDDDGDVDDLTTITHTYDAHGRLLLVETNDDLNADGVTDERTRQVSTIGANGQAAMTVLESDADLDGIAESRTTETFTYDDQRNWIRSLTTVDQTADGVVDSSELMTFTYDGAGRIATQEYASDYDADGLYDASGTYALTYNSAGLDLTHTGESDLANDGVLDGRYISRFTYDAAGNLLGFSSDNESFSPNLHWLDLRAFTYDASHKLLAEVHDADQDGDTIFDLRTSTENHYDSAGNLVSTLGTRDTGVDGSIDDTFEEAFTNDVGGGVLEKVHTDDYGADGSVDSTYRLTYTRAQLDDGLLALMIERFGAP